MTMLDVRPEEKSASLEVRPEKVAAAVPYQGICKHRKKDGKVFEVELISHQFEYAGRRVRLVVAQDISERPCSPDATAPASAKDGSCGAPRGRCGARFQ